MKKTVLVVDDSATMRMSLKAALELYEFQVESAADGDEAWAQLSSGFKPDLILTDIHMPRMNGLDLIRRVRAVPALRFVPILVLTTDSQHALREEARRLGATGWLVKPVAGPDLAQVIRRVLPQ